MYVSNTGHSEINRLRNEQQLNCQFGIDLAAANVAHNPPRARPALQ